MIFVDWAGQIASTVAIPHSSVHHSISPKFLTTPLFVWGFTITIFQMFFRLSVKMVFFFVFLFVFFFGLVWFSFLVEHACSIPSA